MLDFSASYCNFKTRGPIPGMGRDVADQEVVPEALLDAGGCDGDASLLCRSSVSQID
jgi:hypothetical protein